MTLIHLFFIFFYIGLFAIGGGLVAATFMKEILVDQYSLISAEKFYSMIAISESTPGPIGINLATYIGYELFGFWGGVFTTLGQVLPSLIVIVIIAKAYLKFKENVLVKNVMTFIRPCTSGLVLVALISVFSIALLNVQEFNNSYNVFFKSLKEKPLWTISNLFNLRNIFFYGISLIMLFSKKVHPILVVFLGGIFGVLFL